MPAPSVLTIGNFDGPHVGHLAIVRRGRSIADGRGARLVALTFDPPPVAVLRPGDQPPRITATAERVRRLEAAGVDEVVVVEPTAAMLSQTAASYIEALVERYAPVAVVEGPDFRFGKGRGGDMALLRELGERHRFEAVEVPRQEVVLHDLHVVPVSSSLARWLVGRGRVADAARCLGRPFELTATVVQGEQRGRTLGVPTANLDPAALEGFIVPADGVYGCIAVVGGSGGGEAYPAAVSVGTKPTFGRVALTVEAHLLNYDGDLYGQTLTLRFERWVRGQVAFRGVESLLAQLKRDIAEVGETVEIG